MKFRDLEKVKTIIESATGLEVSYAYDDLVVPQHTAFLIQFDDTHQNNFFCYFNDECDKESKEHILAKLNEAGTFCKSKLKYRGLFHLQQKGEKTEINFLESKAR